MEITLITIILIAFAVVSFYKPKFSLKLIAFFLPLYVIRFSIGGLPTTFLEIAILILFVAWVVDDLRKKKFNFHCKQTRIRLRNQKLLLPIFVFLLASVISVFAAPELLPALGIWRAYFLEPLLVFIMILAMAKGMKEEKCILLGLGASVLLISVYAIWQKFIGYGIPEPWAVEEGRRVTSIFPYPNAVGLYLAPLISLFFALAISTKNEFVKKPLRIVSWLVVVLGILATAFAVSEGAILAIAAAMLGILLISKWRLYAIGVVLVLAIVIFAVPTTRDYTTKLLSFQDVSGDVRLALWEGSLNMVKDNPILGVGLTGFEARYAEYKLDKHTEILVYPHNLILNFWTELGLFGLLSYLLILEKFFLPKGKKFLATLNSSPLLIGLAAAALAIIVQGLVDVPYFKNDLAVLFWILLALVSVETKRATAEKVQSKLEG
ncbi:MAG: O-antigen ligase family protein [bacterium]